MPRMWKRRIGANSNTYRSPPDQLPNCTKRNMSTMTFGPSIITV
jgi:hypothetical protein